MDQQPQEPDVVHGLRRKIVKKKVAQTPFEVLTIQCAHCGTKNDYKDTEADKCASCGEKLNKRNLREHTIRKGQVREIIEKELLWECPTCRMLYVEPRRCCLNEHVYREDEIQAGKPIIAYQCQECLILYRKPVRCHSGSMLLKGKILPQLTHEDFAKIVNELAVAGQSHKPIQGMVQ